MEEKKELNTQKEKKEDKPKAETKETLSSSVINELFEMWIIAKKIDQDRRAK